MDVASQQKQLTSFLSSPSAYLLVSHGSRDPRPQAALEYLAQLFCQQILETAAQAHSSDPIGYIHKSAVLQKPLVGTACLELTPTPLHQQIKGFSSQAIAQGYKRLQVLPLFLLPGVHVMEDIPGEVAITQTEIGNNLTINITNYLGSHPKVIDLLIKQKSTISAQAWILLAHGSSRTEAKQPIEIIANQLGAIAAYWSVKPSLEMQLQALIDTGYKQIGILPYFLFSGGITDAIARKIEQLSQQFPSVNLQLAQPLGASPQLANLIWDLTIN